METKKRIPVRLTEEERDILGKAAQADGRSVASYISRAALKQARADLKEAGE